MNLKEFYEKYAIFISHEKIIINCDQCNNQCNPWKTKAQQKINKYGMFLCAHCSFKERFKRGLSEETRNKLREGRLGKKHSDISKQKMSRSAIAKWETTWGRKQKKILAQKAILQNQKTNLDKSKRKVLYISAKNNGIRVCNSSYEFIACEDFLEKDASVKSYQTQVSYNDGERSLDFLVEYNDGRKKAIEVKPKKRLTEEYHKQQIIDSKANAEANGYEFEVWTEVELGNLKSKEATGRADEYRKQHYLLDYAAYRKTKNQQKAIRHYNNKIKDDKIIVYCEFCKAYHKQLRVTYKKNIEKNGKFICIKENGHLVGLKPKSKKVNPYAKEGMKQCNQCERILPFECFGVDKIKSDGYATRCKECRAKTNKEKYHENKD